MVQRPADTESRYPKRKPCGTVGLEALLTVPIEASIPITKTIVFCLYFSGPTAAMEEPNRLRASRKAYRTHVTRILNKVEATLLVDIDEIALTYLRTAITQLEKKREQISTLDQRIIDLEQDPDELEAVILDVEELQDLIMEKINELNQRVEMLSRQTHVVPSEAGEPKTSEAIDENVSSMPSTQPINTITTDTPAVSASGIAPSDIVTSSLTLESFVSTPLMVTSHESVPPPISVTSTSYPSVTYVHSLGPPSLIPTYLHRQLNTVSTVSNPQPWSQYLTKPGKGKLNNEPNDSYKYYSPQSLPSAVCK